MKDLLNRFAFDSEGHLVTIYAAEKGNSYYCPECGERFVIKKSGNVRPGSKRPHFAHSSENSNCNPETILHSAFKKLAAAYLSDCISNNRQLDIFWHCDSCGKDWEVPYLDPYAKVAIEFDLKVCRPDIAILDKDGYPRLAFEVVVTHKPDPRTLDYYRENGIIMLMYCVCEESLQDIPGTLSKPDVVTFCPDSKCPSYNSHAAVVAYQTGTAKCRRCGSVINMKRKVIQTALATWNSRWFKNSGCLCDRKSTLKRESPYYYDPRSGKYRRKLKL